MSWLLYLSELSGISQHIKGEAPASDISPIKEKQDSVILKTVIYFFGWSHIKVHTDERTQFHSTWSHLVVTHASTNRGRRALTSVNMPLS